MAVADLSEEQYSGESTVEFADNRPETITQRKLQEAAKNSPQLQRLRAIQKKANRSPQANQAAQLQAMTGNSASQSIPKKENKTGMPAQLKAGIESLSGMDLSDLRVHYNSSKPAQLNASAYAQGNHIHLGSGQEKHLPHEAWHVVQQQRGRVKPTLQIAGEQVNDDVALESEADEMGRRATAQRKSNPIESDPVESANREKKVRLKNGPQPVIQRRIGLEIESRPSWQAVKDPKKKNPSLITGKHEKLLKGHLFNLETELSGKLEFVTKPVMTGALLEIVVSDMKQIAEKLLYVKPKRCKKKRVEGSIFKEERVIPEAYLPADMEPGMSVTRPETDIFWGGFQATMGVPLEELPKTLPREKRDIEETGYETDANEAIKAAVTIENISAKMKGLITLIIYYIRVGKYSGKGIRPFPKGLTQAMARTDFAHMFSMTREAKQEEKKRFPDDQTWSDEICVAAKVKPGRNLFMGKFHQLGPRASDSEAVEIELTVDAWLKGIYNGTDYLTKEAFLTQEAFVKTEGSEREALLEKQKERIKTMGNLGGETDFVLGGRGAIIELRWLDANIQPHYNWEAFTRKIIEIYDEVRMGATED